MEKLDITEHYIPLDNFEKHDSFEFYDNRDDLIETLKKMIEEKYEQHIFIIIVNEAQTEKNNEELLSTSQ